MGSLLAGAITLLSIHWAQGLVALCVVVTCIGMITTIVGTSSQALAQLLVAEDYRGRVLSLWAVLAMGAPAIGALLMGALADILGFQVVLSMFALLAIPAVIVLFRRRSWLTHAGDCGFQV